jgi:hypothetical protein
VKILALRVAAFRRFVQPAAIEDFGSGVNILAGPNEMGKSTFFHALESAFLTRFKASGAALEEMRPHGGGEPLVEVEFEAQGRHWRLRKQFGRGASAVLSDVTDGRDVARNGEAEDRLAALTGRPGDYPGGFGLLWVRQQRSLLPPDPDLDPETRKEKARGEGAVLRELIGREIEVTAAGDVFDAVRERAKRALDRLLTPTRTAPKKDGPLYNAKSLRDAARAQRDEARLAAEAAERRLARIASMTERLAELESQAGPDVAHSSIKALEARHAAAAEARMRRDLAREAMKAREAERATAVAELETRQKLGEALERQRTALTAAEELSRRIETLARELNDDTATPAAVEALLALDRRHDLAEAELKGQSAIVDIRLDAGGKGKLEVGGEALFEDRLLSVVEPIELRVEGIAAIKISSPHIEHGTRLKRTIASAAVEIRESLHRLGVATVDEARERAALRAAKVGELDAARVRIAELAPEGVQRLVDEIARLEAQLNSHDRPKTSQAEIERLQSEASEARATFDALNARAMPENEFRALEAELLKARQAQANLESEIKRLAIDLANIKGEQAGSDETGRAAQVAACEGELERAEEEFQRLQREAEALKLLEATLADIEANAKTAYFAPVSRRLDRHLERVFGSSLLSFKDDFAVESLERRGIREPIARLSDGTREQLSILVRLAFAEVLAEGGLPVPLVLDDPLVYSDEERLAAVCGELAAAKSVPQIVVLTCREKAFADLPGRRLTVTNWRPERS